MLRWAAAPIAVLAALPAAPAPATAGAARADKILLVSSPGLQWEAVAATAPRPLEELFAAGAVASLSIRTADAVTTAADGYLTIGAGNRASIPAAEAGGAGATPEGGVLVPGDELAAARHDADRRLF